MVQNNNKFMDGTASNKTSGPTGVAAKNATIDKLFQSRNDRDAVSKKRQIFVPLRKIYIPKVIKLQVVKIIEEDVPATELAREISVSMFQLSSRGY